MLTRQDVQRVLEGFDQRLVWEMVMNPADVWLNAWDAHQYARLRAFAFRRDWGALVRYLREYGETAVVETVWQLIKEASPRVAQHLRNVSVSQKRDGGGPVGVRQDPLDGAVPG